MKINLKKTNKNAIIPTRGHETDAGYDLYACFEFPNFKVFLHPSEVLKVSTGIALEIPEGYFGAVYARSGLATKQGLRPTNCVGVIDAPYRGEIIVALYNDSMKPQIISHGDRIAQLVIQPVLNVDFNVVDELSDTDRGSSGFGSTGIN